MKSIKQNKITRTGLKRWFTALILVSVLGFNAMAQVTVTNPGNTTPGLSATYTSLADAITALNAQTAISGPVTISLTAGNPQTSPAGGYAITALLTGASATNTVTIDGGGNTITAPNPAGTSGALNDAIFKFIGSDFMTLQNFVMNENVANTTTTAASNNMVEWGVALLYASTTNGAQNITIQNNTITLNRTYQNTFGIYSNATHSATAPTTSATATTAAGANSGTKIYGNTISNVNNGIVVVGPTAAADFNTGIDIGGTGGAQANTLSNYGTTGTFSGYANVSGTVYGILMRNSIGFNISYNSITSSVGGTTSGTLRGIYNVSASVTPVGTFTNNINNNTIALTYGVASGTMQGITVESTNATVASAMNVNNNNFTTLTASLTSSVTITAISAAAPHLTVNINNNTFTNITTNTTGSFTFISHSYTMPAGGSQTINNNSIVTAFSKTGAGGTVTCTTSGASSPNGTTSSTTNNNFSNITVTGATAITGTLSNDGAGTSPSKIFTGNTYSNWTGGTSAITGAAYNYIGATTSNISNNTFTNITGQGAVTGINVGNTFSGANPLNISNNVISNLSSTGTGGNVAGIICTNVSATVNINNNNINSLSSTGASSVLGISRSGASTTTNIFKNTICNLEGTNAISTINGILVSSGTTVNVYNNRIGDLKAPVANASNPVVGLNFTGGTTINAYFNTVNLAATSSGALFGSSAITASTTPNLTLQNNIFVNTSTPNGAGLTVAYRRSTTTLTTYNSASNTNLFYSTGSYFTDGTNTDATFAAYKIRVASRDGASVSESPNFLSTSCGNSNFLKINTTIATQIESSGAAIAGITDDFEGDTRNATTPDIGADEFAGIAADLTGPAIFLTPQANTACLTGLSVTATITDLSGVSVGPGTMPRLYYKISTDNDTYAGNTSGDNGWKYVEASNFVSPFTFTADFSLLQTAPTATEVIQYFVVAQDLATTPNIGVNTAIFATAPTSVALTAAAFPVAGSSYSYILLNSIPTTVTIGAAGTYTSLTGAGGLFDAINNSALSANTVATIIDATVSEVGTIALNQMNYGCTPNATLTIKPATTSVLSGATASGAIIKLNGADYVTIDGSNSGGTDRSLTIQNTTTTTSGNAVVWLAAPASGNGSTNNVIKNCIIEGNSSTTSFTGLHIGGSSSVGLVTAGAERNNNNTIQNNLFRKTQYGVTMFGFAAVSPDLNNVITQNNFGTATVGEGFSLLAINADRQQNLIVSYNEVQNVRNATITSSTPFGGIRLLDFKDGQCFNNNIHDLAYSGTSTPKIYGIAVTSSTYTTVGNPSNALVYNNTVSRINSTGTSSVWNLTGILASAGYGDRYYNNSVHLTGQLSNTTSGLAAAFANGDANITTVCTNIDVRNNIFNLEGTTTGGNVWAYYSAATTLAGSTLNYNNLRCAGTGATNNIGRFNTVNYTTLSAWQTATGQEANSISVTPTFLSNTDLHLDLGNNSALDNLGTPLAAVTIDIDGTTRSVTTPDMGADEFTTASCAGAVGGTASGSASLCNSGTPTITATGYSIGIGSTYQWVSSTNPGDYPLSGTPVGGQTNPASLTTGVVSTTTYYWLVVTCTSGLATDYSTLVTITVNPSAASVSGATSKCANDPAVTLTENGGTGTSWLWSTSETTQSISVNPSSTTTYTVTVTSPGPCTTTATHTVTVNPNPASVTASASASTICSGSAIDLTSSAAAPPAISVFSETFDSGTGSFTATNNSTGGSNIAAAAWTNRANGYVYSSTTFSGSTGNFVLTNSDAQGTGGTTLTELQSPAINTTGFSTLSLSFSHYYNFFSAPDSVNIEVSTNGTTWTTIQTYKTDQGTASTFATPTINLDSYVGQATLYIKFRYAASFDFYWAVDNVSLTGVPVFTYSWTSTPSGFTSAVQNPTGVTPTVSTDYTVTVTGAAGCTATASTGVVTVNNYPVADAPANVTACDSYTLPALTVGNYFSGTGGTGTAYSAGNTITSSMTMYVYAETGTTPNCTDENSFTITINNTPNADAPANVTACDSYTLPALTVGNYFSGTGGTGTAYSAGNTITSSMTMYVYAETGTTPNCTDENSFTITINTSPTATISGDASICSGNATNLTLNFTGTAPWTYAINGGAPATTSNNPETVSVSPVTNTVYTITSLSDANCSGSGSGSATVNVSSGPPTFLTSFQSAPASACAGNVVTVTLNPVAGADAYTWSVPAGTLINGVPGPLVTTSNSVTITLGTLAPNNSGWSICVIASNPCGTSQNKCVSIRGALSAPSVIAGPKTACPSTSVGYSVNPVAGANSYIWSGTGGITFTGSGTSITANFPGGFTSGNICVSAQLACGYTGPSRCMTVSTSVPTLGAMTGPFAVCPGQTNLVYSIPPVAGAATYNWTIPNNVTVNSGLGTNAVNVSIGNGFNIGNICVNVTSICGVVSPSRCNSISSVKPYTPGNISGAANGVCNTTITYSVPAVAGITSYNWTAPAGATFATANGTNTIDVTYPANFTTGQLCVVAVNGCGSSPSRCINVKGAPASAGNISDPGVVCANEQGVQFTIAPIFGASNYAWTVPSGVTIVAGQGTTTLTVDWGSNSGVIGVTASNACGNSGTKTRSVTITCRNSSSNLPSAEVIAYPNPVSSELTVEMNTLSAGNYSLTMTDLAGRVMLQQALSVTEGKNESKLDVSTYAKGVYVLTVKSETGFTKQIRVTVQ